MCYQYYLRGKIIKAIKYLGLMAEVALMLLCHLQTLEQLLPRILILISALVIYYFGYMIIIDRGSLCVDLAHKLPEIVSYQQEC